MQTQEGGYDVLGLNGYAIEVKFQEKLQIEKWWKQTVEQAVDKMPVLFFRRSREDWRVVVPNNFYLRKKHRSIPPEKISILYYSIIPIDYFVEQVNEDT